MRVEGNGAIMKQRWASKLFAAIKGERLSVPKSLPFTLHALPFTLLSRSSPSTLHPLTLHAAANLPTGSPAANLEEGKALFESGRYQDAISKFIMVLRSDPQNPDARRYLRQSVDQLRQNPTATHRGLDGTPPPTAQKEMREMLQKRAALSLDLTAIPGVQINTQNAVTQVIIETGQIFGDNNGGLKEEGVPILDRVSAWLKTFGQQPIIIHCYPEELQDISSTGSLFLRRYSELYNFFIEERKLSPQRLISADLLADDAASGRATPQASDVGTASRIVIETLGSQSSLLDGAMPSAAPKTAIARWLEFAVISQRDSFNPDEGEWSTLDLAALGRTGLRSWAFKILPEDHASNTDAAVYELSGKGNILKRLDWDGRNPKTGSFVPSGGYIARITATDSDGTIKTEQVTVRVDNTSAPETLTNKEEPASAAKPKPAAKKTKKSKKKKAAAAPQRFPLPTPVAESSPAAAPAPAPLPRRLPHRDPRLLNRRHRSPRTIRRMPFGNRSFNLTRAAATWRLPSRRRSSASAKRWKSIRCRKCALWVLPARKKTAPYSWPKNGRRASVAFCSTNIMSTKNA